jgi:Holliday junction DNA helicase RuvA
MLSQISGVSKKIAERIVVELKDKIEEAWVVETGSAQRALSADEQRINDATLALMALGYKQAVALEAARGAAAALGAEAGVEALVRAALKQGL